MSNTSKLNGIYFALMLNRMQSLYYTLLISRSIYEPYLIWVILIAGLVTDYTIRLLFNYSSRNDFAQEKYYLYSNNPKWIVVLLSSFYLLFNISIQVISYLDSIKIFISPFSNLILYIVMFLFLGLSLLRQGIHSTIRFSIITFIVTFPAIIFTLTFLFYPEFDIHRISPLIPSSFNSHSIIPIVRIFAFYQSTIFLMFFLPYINFNKKGLKIIRGFNLFTTFLYMITVLSLLMFLGIGYAKVATYPTYIQLRYYMFAFVERIDVIIIALILIVFIFIIAIHMYLIEQAIQHLIPVQFNAFKLRLSVALLLFTSIYVSYYYLWGTNKAKNTWIWIQTIMGIFIFISLPIYLKWKLRRGVLE